MLNTVTVLITRPSFQEETGIVLAWIFLRGRIALCSLKRMPVVPKSDNTVRICGDYTATINQSVEDEPYVLPITQDLYTALVGSKVCSKLDLSHAYAQLNVDKESQEYLTISSHKGLYS